MAYKNVNVAIRVKKVGHPCSRLNESNSYFIFTWIIKHKCKRKELAEETGREKTTFGVQVLPWIQNRYFCETDENLTGIPTTFLISFQLDISSKKFLPYAIHFQYSKSRQESQFSNFNFLPMIKFCQIF